MGWKMISQSRGNEKASDKGGVAVINPIKRDWERRVTAKKI